MSTYDTYERSIEDGRPIHFYRFTLGSTVWRYTSADEDLTIDGLLWRAVAIEDGGVSQTGESSADTLSITASWTIGPAQVYMSTPPSEPITVERLALHEGMSIPVVNYVGEILQVNFPIPGQVTISAHTLSATMRRAGLRLGWQRTCPYALYDPVTCKVDPNAFGTQVKVESVNGYEIVLSGLQQGVNYQGGYYSWAHPVQGVHARPLRRTMRVVYHHRLSRRPTRSSHRARTTSSYRPAPVRSCGHSQVLVVAVREARTAIRSSEKAPK